MAARGQSTVAAILLAAGDGIRLGAGQPKAFCEVGGRSLLEHCLRRFLEHPLVGDVIVVAPLPMLPQARAIIARTATAPTASAPGREVTLIAGGPRRQDSVLLGLAQLRVEVADVLVH